MSRSVMKHNFSEVPRAEIPRSSFNRTHGHKTTFDSGFLIPILVDEVLPGDTYNVKTHGFARMATPIKPIMDNMYMETFFFFVPNRLLWQQWERFMGEENVPNEGDPFPSVPNLTVTAAEQDTLGEQNIYDYMGLPTHGVADTRFITLPLRAYNLIWKEWFKDQNLQEDPPIRINQTDNLDDYRILRRGKRHDYFTSCLPFPQKGEEVTIPTLDSAPIVGNGAPLFQDDTQTTIGNLQNESGGNASFTNASGTLATAIWSEPALTVDLSTATAVSINDLRVAFQLQKLLERDARGGTRYTEILNAHFGVTSPDARLQRPEFLGGGSTPINMNQVEQTAATQTDSPQGNLAAYATANIHNHGFTKSFVEHGWIIGMVNVRADITYQDVFERQWLRHTKYEFYWPALAHIGEQAVYEFEIYPTDNTTWPGWSVTANPRDIIGNLSGPKADEGNNPGQLPGTRDYETPAGVFGYQERYAEYRYKPSRITGKFQSRTATPLDIWHLAQDFSAQPQLGPDFIQDQPPVDRVISVPTEPQFIADFFFDMKCARPMPLRGVPGYIDRF